MKTYMHLWWYLAEFCLEWMSNVSDKSCRESQNTHFVFSNFCSENRAFYEIMWKNVVKPERPQVTIWRMSVACWIRLYARKHTPAPVHPHPHKNTHARTRIYTDICKTFCFSTATMVSWKHLSVRSTLYVHCQSCSSSLPARTFAK